MKTKGLSAERIAMYKMRLESLLSNIENDKDFVANRWEKRNGVSHDFVVACRNIGYVSSHVLLKNKMYFVAKLSSKSVEPIHAKNVFLEVSKISRERVMGRSKAIPETITEDLVKTESYINAITSFSDREIIGELKRRGYTGKLAKTEVFDI